MKSKTQIQSEIAKLQKELKILEETEKLQEWIKVPELKIEVQKNCSPECKYKDIIIPKGCRLMTFQEGVYLFDNKILDNFSDKNYEWIAHFSKRNKEFNINPALASHWFVDGLFLLGYCDVDGDGGYASPVRFVRDLK